MIAPTHIAFACAVGQLAGANPYNLKLLALGALLPDIDHPQSTAGRFLFFLSIPLNKKFGHRTIIHGFFLWGLVTLSGFLWEPLFIVGAGALSHCLLDAWNLGGVQALEPFSEKVCVIFNRQWRIGAGSKAEMIILLLFLGLFWVGNLVSTMGGIRAVVGETLGAYDIAYERYLREGLKKCHMEGEIRTIGGDIIQGKWLIIGKEKNDGLAIKHNDKILHIPSDGHFLDAKLRVNEEKKWKTATVRGFAETKRFVYMQNKDGIWITRNIGQMVYGEIIGDEIEIEMWKAGTSVATSPKAVNKEKKEKKEGIRSYNAFNQSFSKAKKIMLKQVYNDHLTTFYCGNPFTARKKVVPSDKYTPKRANARAKRIEWEHIVPAENFGRAFKEWREGDPDCVNNQGKAFKGRNCARKKAKAFRYMEADLYNLVPAIGEINGLRSNYRVGMIPGEKRQFGACDMEIENRTAEPAPEVRGNIARTYFYMNEAYPDKGIVGNSNRKLLEAWDKSDHVDQWECERARRIKKIQGNENFFVTRACG